jgi:hypothetical protein
MTQSDTVTQMFEEGSLIAVGYTAKQIILPGDIIHTARILGKCNERIFHFHVFFLF